MGITIFFFIERMVLRRYKKEQTISSKIINEVAKKKTLVKKVKQVSLNTLSSLFFIITWPADILFSTVLNLIGPKLTLRNNSIKNFLQKADLTVKDHIQSLILIIYLAILYLLTYSKLEGYGFGIIMLYSIVFGFTIKHVIYILDYNILPVKLKRRVSKPFVFFILILLLDFFGLICVFAMIDSSKNAYRFHFPKLFEIFLELIDFREQTKLLFSNKKVDFYSLVQIIAIWLFYYSFISHVFKFKLFRQNDEDIFWLMQRNRDLGKFEANLKLIQKLKSKNEEMLLVEMISLVGSNKIEEAKLVSLKIDPVKYKDDRNFYIKILYCILTEKFNIKVIREIVRDAIDSGVRDIRIFGAIQLIAFELRIQHFLISVFLSREKKYPLTMVGLRKANGQFDKALSIIQQNKDTLENESDRCIMYLQLFIVESMFIFERTKLEAYIKSWNDKYLEELENSIFALKDNFELMTVYEVFIRLIVYAEALESNDIDRLVHLNNYFKTSINTDSEIDNKIMNYIDKKRKELKKALAKIYF